MPLFVGLDVSLRTTSICVVEADGSVVWEGKASEPAPLMKALSPVAQELATGNGHLRLPFARDGRDRIRETIDTRRAEPQRGSARNPVFAAQWLACACPYRRFAGALAVTCARLGVGCGSLLLHRGGLAPPALRRFLRRTDNLDEERGFRVRPIQPCWLIVAGRSNGASVRAWGSCFCYTRLLGCSPSQRFELCRGHPALAEIKGEEWRRCCSPPSAASFSSIPGSSTSPILTRWGNSTSAPPSCSSPRLFKQLGFQPISPSSAACPILSSGWSTPGNLCRREPMLLAAPAHRGPTRIWPRRSRHTAGDRSSSPVSGSRRGSHSWPFPPLPPVSRCSSSSMRPRRATWAHDPPPSIVSCTRAPFQRRPISSSPSGRKRAPIPTSAQRCLCSAHSAEDIPRPPLPPAPCLSRRQWRRRCFVTQK